MKKLLYSVLMALIIGGYAIAIADEVSLTPVTVPDDTSVIRSTDTYGDNYISTYANIKADIGGGGGDTDSTITYNVKSEYGAMGDGIQKFDGAITSGDATFTSATAAFTSADIGKVITIKDAGGAALDLTTTIASINSATSVELATTASATVSAKPYTYGTDDTTAIRAAFAALGSDAVVGKTGIIFFPEGTYMVDGAFDQSGLSQIAFPAIPFDSPVTTFYIKGAAPSAPNAIANNGVIIYGTKYGTNGSYSILSVTDSTGGGTGNIARINAVFENIRFRTVQDPTHTAVNLKDVDQAQGDNVYFDTSATYDSPALPTHNDSFALKMPDMLAGNVSGGWRNLKIKTFYNGVRLGEHSLIISAFIVQCVNALNFFDSRYIAQVFQVAVEQCRNAVLVSSSGSTTSYFKIYALDLEHHTGTFANVTDVVDSSNLGVGEIHYTIFDNGGGSSFDVTGGKYISRHNSKLNIKEQRPVSGDHFRIVNSSTDSSTSGAGLFLMQNDTTAVDSGSRLGFLAFGGLSNVANTYVYGAAVQGLAAEAYTSTAAGTHMQFRTVPTGSTTNTERMRITSQGNVGVGTTTPTALLQVGSTGSTAFQISTAGAITSAGNVGISTVAPTSCLCKTYTNGLCTQLASCI